MDDREGVSEGPRKDAVIYEQPHGCRCSVPSSIFQQFLYSRDTFPVGFVAFRLRSPYIELQTEKIFLYGGISKSPPIPFYCEE